MSLSGGAKSVRSLAEGGRKPVQVDACHISEPKAGTSAASPSDLFITAPSFRGLSNGIPGTKWHDGSGADGKHYWLTPPEMYSKLDAEFHFDFDPCPFPIPKGFDGLLCEWGQSNYVNPPFGTIIHNGKKKGPTAWMRKAIIEQQKGKLSVVVYPIDKWIFMMLGAMGVSDVRNLGDVRWLATEDKSRGTGTGRHVAAFILRPPKFLGDCKNPNDTD